jgi:hypothetical protein
MKTKWFLSIVLPLACSFLASFSTLPGGDSFEVYLDNELLMKEHMWGERTIKAITLEKNSRATLLVSFSHCGVTGTSRSLSLIDDQHKVLKEWKYADVGPSVKDPMAMPANEVVAAIAGRNASIYYRSKELDHAVMLAPMRLVDRSSASR